MTVRVARPFLRPALALIACAALIVSGQSQEAPFGGAFRVVRQHTGLPGIDRGLRANDAPREPGGRATRAMAHIQRADGSVPTRQYLAGSVIVKFKIGTGDNSVLNAMTAVDGYQLRRPSYADFEIMNIAAT